MSPQPLRSFASTDRFLAEIAAPATLRPGYVLLGDEAFLYQRCRQGVLAALAPEATRDFSLHDFDLADTPIFEAHRLRADAIADGSLPGPFRAQPQAALRPRFQEGRICRHRYLLPQPQPAGRAALRRRPPAHPYRPAPHGLSGQRALRANPRDAGRRLRPGRAGPRG